MSYFYSAPHAAWFFYPYPYAYPALSNDPPCDCSYTTAPSIHKLFGLPPVHTTIPPAAEPPSCHSVLPDHAATMEIVWKGFWSVPAPHTSQQVVQESLAVPFAPPAPSAPVVDPPSQTAHAPYMPALVLPLTSRTQCMVPTHPLSHHLHPLHPSWILHHALHAHFTRQHQCHHLHQAHSTWLPYPTPHPSHIQQLCLHLCHIPSLRPCPWWS